MQEKKVKSTLNSHLEFFCSRALVWWPYLNVSCLSSVIQCLTFTIVVIFLVFIIIIITTPFCIIILIYIKMMMIMLDSGG